MRMQRRHFIVSSLTSSTGIMTFGIFHGCGSAKAPWSDQITGILGTYLHVGSEHHQLISLFIEDLRAGKNTTEGPDENQSILSGDRGLAATERYVIQEFFRFSNYRMWLRKTDQSLGPTPKNGSLDPSDEW